MKNFKETVNQQKKIDQQIYEDAVAGVRSIVDTSCKERKRRSILETDTEYLANQVLDYFHMEHIEVGEEVKESERLEYILDSAGILKRIVKLEKNWYKRESFPLLIKEREREKYQVLFPAKSGGYKYMEEDTGVEKKVTKQMVQNFETEAFCLYPPFQNENLSVKSFLKVIWRPYGWQDWFVLIMLAFAVAIMGTVVPFVNQFIFDTVIPSGTRKDIGPVMALLFGVVITTGLFHMVRTIWVIRTGDIGKMWIESGVWNRLFRLPASFFKKYESGDLSNRVFMIGSLCEAIQKGLVPAVLTLIFSGVYLFQIHLLSGALLGPSCLILLLLIVITLENACISMKSNQKENEINAKLSGFLYQVYSGIRKIKLCGAENRVFAKWSEMFKEHVEVQFRKPVLAKYYGAIRNLITVGGTLIIYQVIYKKEISASSYISYQIAFGNLLAAVVQLGILADLVAYLIPALKMVEPVLREKEESSAGGSKVHKLNGDIELSNISFKYQPEMDYVLKDMNVSIKAGEYVAIVGPSGCGKSTLFRLLLGFETPQKGAIYYDGKDLAMLNLRSVRKRIGTVLQDGKLFEGDLFANISLCNPELTIDEAWEAAKVAGLAEDIEAMPMGMFTMVSENAGGLSGGQKQRVLISRVLAMNPDILLFDEATSALDNLTQAVVVKSIEQMKGTRIVIAHRLSTIKKCDRILFMENGHVSEDGTYEELMERNGGFAALAKRQLV